MSRERTLSMVEKLTPSIEGGHNGKEIPTREELVKRWRNAPEGVYKYPAGAIKDGAGNVIRTWSAGARLWIGDQQEVMDSCQRPWVIETVKKAFETLGPKQNVSVLERGFGMGLVAGEIMDHLRRLPQGGYYTVIELNRQVAGHARNIWLPKQIRIDKNKATSEIGGSYNGPNISVEIIEGDAVQETERLAELKRKFHLIVSDTFPLSKDESSINDLLDLETLVKCLESDGVFAFFGFHVGFQGGMNERQRSLVESHFGHVSRTMIEGINSPPDYKYFNPENGSVVKELPVIICSKPRIQPAA